MLIPSDLDRVRFQREYMFYDNVIRYNQQALERGVRPISVTQGSQMHDFLMRKLYNDYLTDEERAAARAAQRDGLEPSPLVHTNIVNVMDAMNEIFSMSVSDFVPYERDNATGKVPVDAQGHIERNSNAGKVIDSQYQTFIDESGLIRGVTELGADDKFLPISPFDNAFTNLGSVRDAGGRLVWLRASDVTGNIHDLRHRGGASLAIPYYLRQASTGNFRQKTARDKDGKDIDVSFETYEDFCGLSRLKPYIDPSDYDKIKTNVLSAFKGAEDYSQETMDKFNHMIGVSETILHELNNRGYAFKLEPSSHPGQINCVIENTGVSVRLMDVPEHMMYIGHCYCNGVQYSVKSSEEFYNPGVIEDMKALNRRDADRLWHNVDPTDWSTFGVDPNIMVNNVLFALNEPVPGLGDMDHEDTAYRLRDGKDYFTDNFKRYATYATSENTRVAVPSSTTDNSPLLIKSFAPRRDKKTGQVHRDENGNYRRYDECVQYVADVRKQTKYPPAARTLSAAENDLRKLIDTARDTFTAEVNVEAINELYEANREAVDAWRDWDRYRGSYQNMEGVDEPAVAPFIPEFTGDNDVVALQYQYWNFIAGISDKLPDMAKDVDLSGVSNRMLYCQNHLEVYLDDNLGTFDLDNDSGTRFNPALVERFGSSESTVRIKDRVVRDLRTLDISGDELRGDSAYLNRVKDKLIKFDENTARPLSLDGNGLEARLLGNIIGGAAQRGLKIDPESVFIDDGGIIRYQGIRRIGMRSTSSELKEVTGEIGPIFPVSDDGTVRTNYAGSDNYDIVPAMRATVEYRTFGFNRDLMDRIHVHTWEDDLIRRVRLQIGRDIESTGLGSSVGDASSLLSFWRHELEGERYAFDQREVSDALHMPESVNEARRRSNGTKVVFPNVIAENANIFAMMNDRERNDADAELFRAMDDRAGGWFAQSDFMDWKSMVEAENGYFAPAAATGGVNRVVKRLVDGATIDGEGHIVPKEGEHFSLFEKESGLSDWSHYDCLKRRDMAVSNMEHANGLAERARVAQCVMGGWTQDDAFVVSRAFADHYGVTEESGVMNPLMVGDKLSDKHGNKGVISAIVDPNMSDEDADARGLRAVRDFMRANPELEVVMAPFSGMSRNNGGTAREAMQATHDLVMPDGSVIPAGIGELDIIIHDKTAESKTNIYTDEDIAAGGGRRCGWQLSSALLSHGCENVMREMFGHNMKGLANLREYLRTCGMDMEPDGTMRIGLTATVAGDERRIIDCPVLSENKGRRQTAVDNTMRNLDRAGGVMPIPFPLEFKSGATFPETVLADGSVAYEMPIMSAHLRSGTELSDGTTTTHDYTNNYRHILFSIMDWQKAKSKGDEDGMAKAQAQAQAQYNRLQEDVSERRLTSSRNTVKSEIMSARLSNSATAIWSPDPSLAMDEVRVSTAIGESLDLQDGDKVLIWRDPVLTGNNLRYMTVRLDDDLSMDLTGISVHPGLAKPIGGDFDGDTIGIWKPTIRGAILECEHKLTVEANLLDYTNPPDAEGLYDLNFNFGDDFAIACAENPALAAKYDECRRRANAIEACADDVFVKEDGMVLSIEDARYDVVNELSACLHVGMRDQAGIVPISYESPKEHIASLERACVDTGVKGNSKKLSEEYARYFGVEVAYDENTERLDMDSFKDVGESLCDLHDDEMCAVAMTATTSFTGVAGSYPQYIQMALCGDSCDTPEEVMTSLNNLTSKMYQVALDWKHYGEKAMREIPIMQGAYRDTWNGLSLSKDDNGNYYRNRDDDGKYISLSPDAWIKQFVEVSDDLGMKYDMDDVKRISRAMTVVDENGKAKIKGFEELTKDSGSLLHRMAYAHDFDVYKQAAEQNDNVFQSPASQFYAPIAVKAAQKAKLDGIDYEAEGRNRMIVHDTQSKKRTFTHIDATGAEVVETKTPVFENVEENREPVAMAEIEAPEVSDEEMVADEESVGLV